MKKERSRRIVTIQTIMCGIKDTEIVKYFLCRHCMTFNWYAQCQFDDVYKYVFCHEEKEDISMVSQLNL